MLQQEPISQNEISPLLGSDTIRQGRIAIVVSLVAVLVFMLIYYRFAGLVSCLALLFNLTLILALMIFVGAAFSLPGMAALVLTVGMSVDANVLIFERIREEMRAGAALRMAIRNGFQRATRTIVDANVTTLITALVLYLIGTEQLRAFAVALILGILMTLFTGIFCSRVVFDIAEKMGRLKRLSMMQLPDTQWDLFKKRKIAALISGALIVMAIAAVAMRGNKIFDIDFSGGTSVQLLLKEPMALAEVRRRADSLRTKGIAEDVSVTEVKSEQLGSSVIYRIDTSLPSLDAKTATSEQVGSAIGNIQQALIEAFRDDQGESLLKSRSLKYTAPTTPQGDAEPAAPALPEIQGGTDGDMLPSDTPPTPDPTTAPADSQGSAVPSKVDGQALTGSRGEELLAYAGDTLLAQADLGADTAPANTAQAPTVVSDSSSLRSESRLQFDEKINPETLEDMIKESARALGMVEPDVRLVSDESNWTEGSSKGHKTWRVQLSSTPNQAEQILSSLRTELDSTPVWLSANQIGSAVAGDKTRLAVAAILGSLLGIIGYIWIRFQHVTYGFAAVAALVHDVVITIGALAASYWLKDYFGFMMVDEFKISLPVVAALLTIIGYSLNDTIVVFDRIREVKGKSPHLSSEIINASINQTLSRTVLTSLTTLLAVVILYFIGGQGIHAFAFALMVGIIVGTYSSIFVASPLLLWMSRRDQTSSVQPARVATGASDAVK